MDDPRWDLEELTRTFGPTPPQPKAPDGERRSGPPRLLLPLLVIGVAAGAALLGALASRTSSPRRDPDGTGAGAASQSSSSPTTTATAASSDAVFDDGILRTSGGRSFRLGAPGDAFLLGDWDCDGDRTPALYRPSTGEVFLFDGWPTAGPLSSRPPQSSGVLHGDAIVSERSGCDRVVVSPDPLTPP